MTKSADTGKRMKLEPKVPNEETRAAMRELKDPDYRRKAKKFESVKELMDDLKS